MSWTCCGNQYENDKANCPECGWARINVEAMASAKPHSEGRGMNTLASNLDILRDIVSFAYEMGFHELGYDIVGELEAQLPHADEPAPHHIKRECIAGRNWCADPDAVPVGIRQCVDCENCEPREKRNAD